MTIQNSLWNPPPNILTLSSDRVDIWLANLDQKTSILQQIQTLSTDEQSRADRFHFERDKWRFIAARGILREILGRYLDIDPSKLQFVYSSRGKPALAEIFNHMKLNFNLSHSQDLAVYGVTRDRSIGIDLEYIRPMPDAEQIVSRFFTEAEKAAFRQLPPSQKQAAFFHAWTRKEAYLKATGDGLAKQIDRIEVSLVPGETARILSIDGDSQAAEGWFLQELILPPNYVGTLAIERQDCCIRF